MKKAFTLLEVVISVAIFMIILVFLYKVLDDTKISNAKFEQHIYKSDDINHLYKIFLEDIAEASSIITVKNDKDKNSIVTFQSNNSFNNPFYLHKTYMVSSNNHLIRIESKKAFEKEKSGLDFYNNSFVDILVKDIKKFVVLVKDDKYAFIIEPKEGDKIMFPTYRIQKDKTTNTPGNNNSTKDKEIGENETEEKKSEEKK